MIYIYILVRTYVPRVAIIKELPQQDQLAVVNDKLKIKSIGQLATVYLKPFINYDKQEEVLFLYIFNNNNICIMINLKCLLNL